MIQRRNALRGNILGEPGEFDVDDTEVLMNDVATQGDFPVGRIVEKLASYARKS